MRTQPKPALPRIGNPHIQGPNAVGAHGTGVLDVNPPDVWKAARRVARTEADFGSTLTDVLRVLAGTGGMAGIDLIATYFASFYDPLAEDAAAAGRGLVKALDGVAVGLTTSANNFSAADHNSSVGSTGSAKKESLPHMFDVPAIRPASATSGVFTGKLGILESAVTLSGALALAPTGHQGQLEAAASAWEKFATSLTGFSVDLDNAIDLITISSAATSKLGGRGVPNPGQTITSWQAAMRAFVNRIWGARPWKSDTSPSNAAPLTVLGDCAAEMCNACRTLANAINQTRSKLEALLRDAAIGLGIEIGLALIPGVDIADAIAAAADPELLAALAEQCLKVIYSDYFVPVQGTEAELRSLRRKLEAGMQSLPSIQAMEAQAESVSARAMSDFQYPGLLGTSPATKANRGTPAPKGIKYPVNLLTMEGVGVGNNLKRAHTISKHVGQTTAQLRQRLKDEPGIPAASTFTNAEAAQNLVQAAINANQGTDGPPPTGITAWLQNPVPNPKYFTYTPGGITGTTLPRGATQPQEAHSVLIALKYMPNLNPKFIVLTAFPEN